MNLVIRYFLTILHHPSAQAAWRPLDEPTRSSAFNLSPSANPHRESPIIPTLGGLPMPAALSHRNATFPGNPRTATDSVLLDRILSAPNSATSLGSSVNFQHVSTSQPEFQGTIEARFQQTRTVPLEQNQYHNASTDLAPGRPHLFTSNCICRYRAVQPLNAFSRLLMMPS
jgi:hypothetical protein